MLFRCFGQVTGEMYTASIRSGRFVATFIRWGSTNEWFKGHATKVYISYDGNEIFDVRFEDGFLQRKVRPEHIRPIMHPGHFRPGTIVEVKQRGCAEYEIARIDICYDDASFDTTLLEMGQTAGRIRYTRPYQHSELVWAHQLDYSLLGRGCNCTKRGE